MTKDDKKKVHLVSIKPSHVEFLRKLGSLLPRSKNRPNLSGGIESAVDQLQKGDYEYNRVSKKP